MKIDFKVVLAMFVALSCAQSVTANETADGRELAKVIGQALATGYVDAEIRSSCLIQVTTDDREYVANEAECRESLIELQSVLSEGEGRTDQLDQVRRFRSQYGI